MSIETTSLAAAFALCCVLPLVAQDDRQPKVQPRLSLAFDHHDVTALVALIGRVSGQRISVPESLAGRISIRLRNIPWRKALEHIVRTHGHKVMTTRAGQLRIVERLLALAPPPDHPDHGVHELRGVEEGGRRRDGGG